jgi:hypothetical protein
MLTVATDAFATPELNAKYSIRNPSMYVTWLITTTACSRLASAKCSLPEMRIRQKPRVNRADRAHNLMQFFARAVYEEEFWLHNNTSSIRLSVRNLLL